MTRLQHTLDQPRRTYTWVRRAVLGMLVLAAVAGLAAALAHVLPLLLLPLAISAGIALRRIF